MTTHEITICGRPITLKWSVETQKRFTYRLQTIGGHPSEGSFRSAKTSQAAFTKVLWALLPSSEIAAFPTPEDLFVAIDHESEAESIGSAIIAIYNEMNPDAEKKTTSGK
jgi:hypothetical protein